jgi:hypothetical protein
VKGETSGSSGLFFKLGEETKRIFKIVLNRLWTLAELYETVNKYSLQKDMSKCVPPRE